MSSNLWRSTHSDNRSERGLCRVIIGESELVGNADPLRDNVPRAITGEKLDAIIGALRGGHVTSCHSLSEAPCQRRVRSSFENIVQPIGFSP
jgi:hypothetical protein